MIYIPSDESDLIYVEETAVPSINVQPVDPAVMQTGIVNDFDNPAFTDQTGADRGVVIGEARNDAELIPPAPQTFTVPFEQFVGFTPYTRDIPRTPATNGVINVNVKPAPVTQTEQSKTQLLQDDAVVFTGTDSPYVWNISGLSWIGIIGLLIAIGIVIYVSKKGA